MSSENVTIKTLDGKMIDGDINLGARGRVSELFTDHAVYFVEMQNTIDDMGSAKEKIFFNKEHIVWVKPRERKMTDKREYLDNLKYETVVLKTVEGVVVEGKINLQNNATIEGYFENFMVEQPFIIITDAVDSNSTGHHTLFINKKAIIFIETVR